MPKGEYASTLQLEKERRKTVEQEQSAVQQIQQATSQPFLQQPSPPENPTVAPEDNLYLPAFQWYDRQSKRLENAGQNAAAYKAGAVNTLTALEQNQERLAICSQLRAQAAEMRLFDTSRLSGYIQGVFRDILPSLEPEALEQELERAADTLPPDQIVDTTRAVRQLWLSRLRVRTLLADFQKEMDHPLSPAQEALIREVYAGFRAAVSSYPEEAEHETFSARLRQASLRLMNLSNYLENLRNIALNDSTENKFELELSLKKNQERVEWNAGVLRQAEAMGLAGSVSLADKAFQEQVQRQAPLRNMEDIFRNHSQQVELMTGHKENSLAPQLEDCVSRIHAVTQRSVVSALRFSQVKTRLEAAAGGLGAEHAALKAQLETLSSQFSTVQNTLDHNVQFCGAVLTSPGGLDALAKHLDLPVHTVTNSKINWMCTAQAGLSTFQLSLSACMDHLADLCTSPAECEAFLLRVNPFAKNINSVAQSSLGAETELTPAFLEETLSQITSDSAYLIAMAKMASAQITVSDFDDFPLGTTQLPPAMEAQVKKKCVSFPLLSDTIAKNFDENFTTALTFPRTQILRSAHQEESKEEKQEFEQYLARRITHFHKELDVNAASFSRCLAYLNIRNGELTQQLKENPGELFQERVITMLTKLVSNLAPSMRTTIELRALELSRTLTEKQHSSYEELDAIASDIMGKAIEDSRSIAKMSEYLISSVEKLIHISKDNPVDGKDTTKWLSLIMPSYLLRLESTIEHEYGYSYETAFEFLNSGKALATMHGVTSYVQFALHLAENRDWQGWASQFRWNLDSDSDALAQYGVTQMERHAEERRRLLDLQREQLEQKKQAGEITPDEYRAADNKLLLDRIECDDHEDLIKAKESLAIYGAHTEKLRKASLRKLEGSSPSPQEAEQLRQHAEQTRLQRQKAQAERLQQQEKDRLAREQENKKNAQALEKLQRLKETDLKLRADYELQQKAYEAAKKEYEKPENALLRRENQARMQTLNTEEQAKTESISRLKAQVKLRQELEQQQQNGAQLNIPLQQVKNQLALYVPKNALGRLDDYVVNNRTEKGVGKCEALWGNMFGVKSSKLSARIGAHVKRFLNSSVITVASISATARQVLAASGLAAQKLTPASANSLTAEESKRMSQHLSLITSLSDSGMNSEVLDTVAALCNSNEEAILRTRYLRETPDAARAVALYFLSNHFLNQYGGPLDSAFKLKNGQELIDRVTAVRNNTEPLFNAILARPEYQLSVEERHLRDIHAGQEACRSQLLKSQLGPPPVEPRSTFLDDMPKFIQDLRQEGNHAVQQTREADSMVTHQKEETDALEEHLRKYRQDSALREREIEALQAARFALLQEKERRADLQRRDDLLKKGLLLGGKQVSPWVLGEVESLVRQVLGERIQTMPYRELSAALQGYNYAVLTNRAAVESYLDGALQQGGDYRYLTSKTLYHRAQEDIAAALGESLLILHTPQQFSQRLEAIKRSPEESKNLFARYRGAVRAIQKHLLEDSDLAPYADDILQQKSAIDTLADGSDMQISKLLGDLRQTLRVNLAALRSACAGLDDATRDATADLIRKKLGPQLVTAGPDSIRLSVERALDHINLMQPAVTHLGDAMREAAAGYDFPPVVIRTYYQRSKGNPALLRKNPAEIRADLTAAHALYEVSLPAMESGLEALLATRIQALTRRLEKVQSADRQSAQGESPVAGELRRQLEFLSGAEGSTLFPPVEEALFALGWDSMQKDEQEKLLQSQFDLAVSGWASSTVRLGGAAIETRRKHSDSVCWSTLLDGLLKHPDLGPYLRGNGALVTELVKKQIASDRPGGIADAASLSTLKVPALYDYLALLQERCALLLPVLESHQEYVGQPQVLKGLITKALEGSVSDARQLETLANTLYLDAMESKFVLEHKDAILAQGQDWSSHRVVVDFGRQQLNTSGSLEFRSVNRLARLRDIDAEAKRFGDNPPPSFYEFYANAYYAEQFGPLEYKPAPRALDQLQKGWQEECRRWAGEKEDRRQFLARLFGKDQLAASYGLSRYASTLVTGVGDSINTDNRDTFEKKLLDVGMSVMRRRTILRHVCDQFKLSVTESLSLERNLEDRFTESEADILAQTKLFITHNAALQSQLTGLQGSAMEAFYRSLRPRVLASLEIRFQTDCENIALAWSNRVRSSGKDRQQQESERGKLARLMERKDNRCNAIAAMENGIYTPLIPLILKDKALSDTLVAGNDAAFSALLEELRHNAAGPMAVLTKQGGVFYSFFDQYMLEYGQKILHGEMAVSEREAESVFRDYYMNKLLTTTFKRGHVSISIESIMRDALKKSVDAKTALESEEGNLITLVSLCDGILAVTDKARLELYRTRLKANSAILADELQRFRREPAFLSFVNQGDAESTGLSNQDQDRTMALVQTFEENMRLHEREFLLLTADSNTYRFDAHARMMRMLEVSAAQLQSSDQIVREHKKVNESAAASVLAAKRAGRELLEQERQAAQPYLEKAAQKVSPLQAATGGGDLTPPQLKKLDAFRSRLAQNRTLTAPVRQLAFDLAASYLSQGENPDAAADMLCANITRVLERVTADAVPDTAAGIAVARLLSALAPRLLRPLGEDDLRTLSGSLDEAKKVGDLFRELERTKALLPTDGCLNPYYADLLTKAAYQAAEPGETAEIRLKEALLRLNNRITLVSAVDKALDAMDPPPVMADRVRLRAGFFDLYASETAAVVVQEKSLQERISKRLQATEFSVERNFILDDRGAYGSLSSDNTQEEEAVFAAQTTREEFEYRLSLGAGKEALAQYAALSPQEKALLGLIVSQHDKLRDVSEFSFSMDLLYRVQKYSAVPGGIDSTIQSYLRGEPIRCGADYAQVSRRLFRGGALNEGVFHSALAILKGLEEHRRRENRDFALLGGSALETQRLMGKTPPSAVSGEDGFQATIRQLAHEDAPLLDRKERSLLDQVSRLKSYELQLLAVILNDRTVLDTSTLPGPAGVVNIKKRTALIKGIEQSTDSILADDPPGPALLTQALQSLCSYQIRDDVALAGQIGVGDLLTDRKTRLDFKLLENALKLLRTAHPESLRLGAVQMANTLVTLPPQEGGDASAYSAYQTYREKIKSPGDLLDFLKTEAQKDGMSDLVGRCAGLTPQENMLFLTLLSRRWLVDSSLNAALSGKTADPDGTQALLDQFLVKGSVTVSDAASVPEAFCGVLSTQINDNIDFLRGNPDLQNFKTKEKLFARKKTTAVDWRLLERALDMTHTASASYAERQSAPPFSPLDG